jgi:hypothetical protein
LEKQTRYVHFEHCIPNDKAHYVIFSILLIPALYQTEIKKKIFEVDSSLGTSANLGRVLRKLESSVLCEGTSDYVPLFVSLFPAQLAISPISLLFSVRYSYCPLTS